jgi:hypothetical protein
MHRQHQATMTAPWLTMWKQPFAKVAPRPTLMQWWSSHRGCWAQQLDPLLGTVTGNMVQKHPPFGTSCWHGLAMPNFLWGIWWLVKRIEKKGAKIEVGHKNSKNPKSTFSDVGVVWVWWPHLKILPCLFLNNIICYSHYDWVLSKMKTVAIHWSTTEFPCSH